MSKYLIQTKRFGLRLIRNEDIKYLIDLDNDSEVKAFFPEGTLSYTEIKDFIKQSQSTLETKNLPCFVIFKRRGEDFIGEAYFDQLDTGEIKVGYLFHKKYWNKGYATEVLKGMLDWARSHIDTDYIIAYADKKNKASFHVMEKCGMEHYKDDYFLDMESAFYRIKNR